MWRFKAPLSGRSGEIRSTDGPSRLNISVTLFPNCVVVPEAGTAVRAKQSCAELLAAVYGIHINTLVSHGITILSAPKGCRLYCSWILHLAPCFLPSAKCLPSLYPSSLSGKVQVVCVFLISLLTFPLTFTAYDFSVVHTLCFAHPVTTSNVQSVHAVPRTSLASMWSLSTHTQFRTWAPDLRLNFPLALQCSWTLHLADTVLPRTPTLRCTVVTCASHMLSLTTQPFCTPFLTLTYLSLLLSPGPSTSKLANSLKCNNK